MEKKYAIVTGASSGIGTELAILLAQRGYHLVLAARSEEKLKQIATDLQSKYNCDTLVCKVDLANDLGPVQPVSYTHLRAHETG
jgi:short-subunit dehydrogenase